MAHTTRENEARNHAATSGSGRRGKSQPKEQNNRRGHPKVCALPPRDFLIESYILDPDEGIPRLRVDRLDIKGRRTAFRAGMEAGCVQADGTRLMSLSDHDLRILYQFRFARAAWLMYFGEDPGDFEVVPRNGRTWDTRAANLVLLSKELRMLRSATNDVSGESVSRSDNGRFFARITLGRKLEYIGTFDTWEEARAAYGAARDKHPDWRKLQKILNAPPRRPLDDLDKRPPS